MPFRRERLYLSVPEQHPLAKKDEIVLSDIDGQNILLFTQIGFWYEFCKEKLPHVHFLMMNEFDAFLRSGGGRGLSVLCVGCTTAAEWDAGREKDCSDP